MSFHDHAEEFGLVLADLKKLPNENVVFCYLIFEKARRGSDWMEEYYERRELEMWLILEKVAEGKPDKPEMMKIVNRHLVRLLQIRNIRNALRATPDYKKEIKFLKMFKLHQLA